MLICFIEDDLADRDEAVALLRDALGLDDANIYTASAMEEGNQILTRARERGEYFDVIIVDLKLPYDKGDNPEMDPDLKLIKLARSLFPKSNIIVRTAFIDSTSLFQIGQCGANEVITKTNINGPRELIRATKEYPIIQRLRAIFGKEGLSVTPRYGGSATLEFNSLVADILRDYDELSDEARKEINKYIPIDGKNGKRIAGHPPDIVSNEEERDV